MRAKIIKLIVRGTEHLPIEIQRGRTRSQINHNLYCLAAENKKEEEFLQ